MSSKKPREPIELLRKRSRTNEDGDDATISAGGKKVRGRPRVDVQDVTAADRRRTQIRLAQRAYRQRQETTISSLKQQSTRLYAIIDEMNRTFVRFNDRIVQSGVLQLKPELTRELKQATEIFISCVTTSNEQALESDGEELREARPTQTSPEATVFAAEKEAQPSQTVPPTETSQSWVFAEIFQKFAQPQPDAAASQPQDYFRNILSPSYDLLNASNQSGQVRRRQFTTDEVLDQTMPTSMSQQPEEADDHSQYQKHQQQQQQSLPFDLVRFPGSEQSPFVPRCVFPVGVPAIGAELQTTPGTSPEDVPYPSGASLSTKTLSLSYGYPFEEVTFARRLMRATLESGFLLLNNSNVHPTVLNYTFKLSLPYMTLDEIRSQFKTILARDVTEDLDWYNTPFLHLGGAGTHYQRRDAQGRPIPLKNTCAVPKIGPSYKRMARIENVTDYQVQDLEGIDLIGYEGEWFDAHDVHGYLEEQWNCRIDPKSSFAKCLVEDENATITDNLTEVTCLSRESPSGTLNKSPPSPTSTNNSFEQSHGLDMPFSNTHPPSRLTAPPRCNNIDQSFQQTLGLDLAPGFGLTYSGNSGYSTIELNNIGKVGQFSVVKQKPKKVARVDVSKLIEKIITRAVCLGRAPGYRRRDVDLAFMEALIPAF